MAPPARHGVLPQLVEGTGPDPVNVWVRLPRTLRSSACLDGRLGPGSRFRSRPAAPSEPQGEHATPPWRKQADAPVSKTGAHGALRVRLPRAARSPTPRGPETWSGGTNAGVAVTNPLRAARLGAGLRRGRTLGGCSRLLTGRDREVPGGFDPHSLRKVGATCRRDPQWPIREAGPLDHRSVFVVGSAGRLDLLPSSTAWLVQPPDTR